MAGLMASPVGLPRPQRASGQAASALDVLAAQRIEIGLARKTGALLCCVDMKGHVGETRARQFGQRPAAGLDAVGEQEDAQAAFAKRGNEQCDSLWLSGSVNAICVLVCCANTNWRDPSEGRATTAC
jgi:hypothetical protein